MAKVERVREFLPAAPAAEYFQRKIEQGWKLVSIDWERELEAGLPPAAEPAAEEVPFGLEVSDDCKHLKENPGEKNALMLMMELIVKDEPISHVAEELNRRGYRNRDGQSWTSGQVFDLLPRLIEAGPRILTNSEYVARKHSQTGPH
jgi:hypothetical protein